MSWVELKHVITFKNRVREKISLLISVNSLLHFSSATKTRKYSVYSVKPESLWKQNHRIISAGEDQQYKIFPCYTGSLVWDYSLLQLLAHDKSPFSKAGPHQEISCVSCSLLTTQCCYPQNHLILHNVKDQIKRASQLRSKKMWELGN